MLDRAKPSGAQIARGSLLEWREEVVIDADDMLETEIVLLEELDESFTIDEVDWLEAWGCCLFLRLFGEDARRHEDPPVKWSQGSLELSDLSRSHVVVSRVMFALDANAE